MLDDRVQDTIQETTPDRQEKDLANGIDNLMLDQDKTTLNMTDTLVPPLGMTEEKHEAEGMKDDDKIPTYNMNKWEQRLQGDDSDLDLDMDTDSNMMAYPFLE